MIIRSLAWFIAFTLAFVAAAPVCIDRLQPRAAAFFDADQDYAKGNQVRAESLYHRSLAGMDVYLGSSLSLRMEPGLLEPPFERAAFIGRGPLTGLEVLNATDACPRCVFIEANYAAVRGADRVLLDPLLAGPRSILRGRCPAFRPLWRPSNLLLLAGFASPAGVFVVSEATERNRLKWQAEPALADDSAVDAVALEKYIGLYLVEFANSEPYRDHLLSELEAQVSALRRRGVECVFYEMPMHPTVMKDPAYLRMRQRLLDVFPPETYGWIVPDPNYAYKTADGFHLTVKSGVAYTQRFVSEARAQKRAVSANPGKAVPAD
jgi:hypothetical protein